MRGVMGIPVSSSDAWLVPVFVLIKELDWPVTFVCTPCPSIRCDRSHATSWVQCCPTSYPAKYSVRFSRGVKLSRTFLMPCQLTLAVWHHPRARRAPSQDVIGRALCVMDAGVTQFVLDRVIGSSLYQLRSTFVTPKDRGYFTELWASSSWDLQMLMSSVPISEELFVVIACFAR
ncbi:hypothetical protein EDB85DRAFT_2200948 [Lactarius pseudohatsudake]|nr:hypothetical protein EDB85DRAFT_2200948 [Lactarius pseudohatsudake]